MATFPEDPAPYEFEIEPEWKTIVTDISDGSEQRKQKRSYAKYNVRLKFDYTEVDVDEMEDIWNFYIARKGSYEAFYIYDFMVSMDHLGLYVGTGDGSTTTFDIPGRSTSITQVYKDNFGIGFFWWVSHSGGGAGNSDRITFDNAPDEGVIVTVDFTGYLRIRCRFADDNLSRETFLGIAFGFGISLEGLNTLE
jgi:hypothetical protein